MAPIGSEDFEAMCMAQIVYFGWRQDHPQPGGQSTIMQASTGAMERRSFRSYLYNVINSSVRSKTPESMKMARRLKQITADVVDLATVAIIED